MTKARELAELSRTIIDTSDATAITINADEEVTLADDLFLADGKKAVFGAGSDLQIYHDSNHSYIVDAGTGNMYLSTNGNGIVMQASLSETMFSALPNAEVRLYYDNGLRLATSSSGVDVTGTLTATGVLTVIDGSTSAPSISNAGDSNTGIYFPADDELGLLVGGSRKLHVTSSGVDIENGTLTGGNATFSGSVTASGLTSSGPINLTAGALAAAGNAGLSHRSSDNKVYLQAGTGGFNILDDQQNTHFFIDSAGAATFSGSVTAAAATFSGLFQVTQTPSDTPGNVGISLKDVGNAIEFGLRLDSTSKDLHIDRYFSGGWHSQMTFDRSTGGIAVSGNVQARRARSNTAGDVALSLQPSDSTIHYGFRIDSSTNSFNLDRVGYGQLLTVDASGKTGLGTVTPQHELIIHSDTNPTLGIVGAGYNDLVAIRFGGGDLTNALGSTNSGAAILSQQAVAGGQAKGDLQFQVNTGDSLHTALTLNNSGTATFSGNVETTGSASKFVSNSSSSGDYIRLYAGSGTGKWDIYGNGANLRIGDNDSAGAVTIDTNVGIGTTGPDLGSGWNRVLHLHSGGAGSHLRFTDTTTGATGDSGLFLGQFQSDSYFINRENGRQYFYVNNSIKMLLSAAGNLGLGSNHEESRRGLGIKGSSPGIHFVDADVTNLRHEIIGGGNAGLEISADYNNVGTGYIRFDVGGVEKARILESGGIAFNGDTAAANALDSYEEGTWTPTIFGDTTAGTYALESARTGGVYTKIGNMVTITAVLRITSITSAGAGTLNFGGLPFPFGPNIAPAWGQGGGIHVEHYGAGSNSTASTYPPPFIGVSSAGQSSFAAQSFGKNYVVSSNIQDLSANSWIYIISGTYQTAT